MMEAVWFAVNLAWKCLVLVGAWMVFKWLVRDGRDTIRDILETIAMAIRAGSMTLKRRLWERIKRESKEEAEGSVE